MPKLYRPPIPIETKLAVACRQLGNSPWIVAASVAEAKKRRLLAHTLETALAVLAERLRCDVRDLRLDHDPPLGDRDKTGEGKSTAYDPPANDPDHLSYRPHGAQFDGSHDVKTRIRGERGQYSDLARIKRRRRRERGEHAREIAAGKPKRRLKRKKPKRGRRRIRSASRWPPKGSRKINWRKR